MVLVMDLQDAMSLVRGHDMDSENTQSRWSLWHTTPSVVGNIPKQIEISHASNPSTAPESETQRLAPTLASILSAYGLVFYDQYVC
jgi:hypothetical protein